MENVQKFPRRWDLKTKIEYLQRKIIVSSILYYELNNSPISDKEYDALSKQLVELMTDYPDIENTQYGYCMSDFDGSTGFDLYYRLTEKDRVYLKNFALRVVGTKTKEIKQQKKGKLF